MSDYTNNPQIYDGRLLTPRQAAKLWQLCPAEWRFCFENTLWEASEALYTEFDRLVSRDAGKSATSGQRPSVTPAATQAGQQELQ